ncbi:MAG: DUF1254 domain-containing protein [Acidimicrobiia bacterium]|nr:DUF1254 domain-containing protein [Acidimicrobiia bacterium]
MSDIPQSLVTPDVLETHLGSLSFTDGAPSAETVDTLRNHLDHVRALDGFITAHRGASVMAIRKGLLDVGVEDNEVIIYSELMDSESLFLTGNADTVYYIGFVDLTSGPMVVETPPDALGVFDDLWFRHVIDFGRPGPDRGEGGRFLLVPSDYDGPLPDSGFHVAHVKTSRVVLLGRSFLENDDPAPTVAVIKAHLKIYPYTPGAYGSSIATLLKGETPVGGPSESPPVRFVEGSGLAFNTVPPNDHTYFDLVNDLVQQERPGALPAEALGSLAALGITHGQPFAPDERMRGILADAAAVGTATGRTLNFRSSGEGEQDWAYYPGSNWVNPLFIGGYSFDTPPPEVTQEGIEPYPPVGHKHIDARFSFFFIATGITPAMCMRLTGVGSQYLLGMLDSDANYLIGSRSYKCTLPAGIPQANFWSLTVYDNQTRSMLQTPQRYPRAGSQSYPTPAAVTNEDGTTDIYFGPEAPTGKESNWIQTVPGKGWFTILRLYSPLQAFFDKTWQAGEIEPIDG